MAQTTTIYLMTGDYADRLRDAYSAAKMAADDRAKDVNQEPLFNGEEHPADTLAAEHAALKAEAEAASKAAKRRVVLEAIGRKKGRDGRPSWADLKAAHPVRTEGDEDVIKGDRLAGLNTDTAEDDLLYASLAEPKFKSRGAYDEWADTLSEGEFNTLLKMAWDLANGAAYNPKSLPASPTQKSGESTP